MKIATIKKKEYYPLEKERLNKVSPGLGIIREVSNLVNYCSACRFSEEVSTKYRNKIPQNILTNW